MVDQVELEEREEQERAEEMERVEKSRQQQLLSENEAQEQLDDEQVQRLSEEFSYVGKDGVRWIAKRRNRIIQNDAGRSQSYVKNHFLKYGDVSKAASDYFQTEFSSGLAGSTRQKRVITHRQLVDNLNEWKFHYVISQLNSLVGVFESSFFLFLLIF